jgi:ketosteroid isomerase-like protein
MKLKLKHILPITALTLASLALGAQNTISPVAAGASRAQQSDNSDVRDIEKLMADYHEAVTSRDGTRLSNLFLLDGTLINVLTDDTYVHVKASSPSAPKVRTSSSRDFAKLVSTTTKKLDPQHTNVVIHTDGAIATVYFDFVFLVDGQANNQGSETWQLVKGADGWRIASIAYSSEPPVQK